MVSAVLVTTVYRMSLTIRDVLPDDLAAVLTLNDAEVPHVGAVDIEQLHWFAEHATYFRIALQADTLAGFLIGLLPGTGYQSLNYLWFCEQYSDFAYVDRVAVAASQRKRGVGSSLYQDFAASIPESVEFMTCEVNLEPPNDASMQYHERLGFRQVGTLSHDSGNKVVALLAKKL